ncbi:protein-L-isoaspartate O-methyltransferase [Anaplasma platys]|uniref:Protein-L-isoaspartate O-methyltransferase n=1 Tax=Anaplasma platys TaxID=949 RepID=A0A858PY76_9RICK|nr:O-methyltransferase [Anaplasma platys]QJC27522.1 protein-L-isoaspartate O-methyltransferase [Anaplasma platys]
MNYTGGLVRSAAENYRDKYISSLFGIRDNDLLSVHDTAPRELKMAQLGIVEGRFLQLLVGVSMVKTIVEVGTCMGFSALCMAKALPEDGHIYTIERDLENATKARKNVENCQLDKKVTVIHGDAREELKTLEHLTPFDMMFIDANKASYCDYLTWASKNIRKGGLIVADNALLFGAVFEERPHGRVTKSAHAAMVAFNKELSNEAKYLSSLLPTNEGLLVAIKRT